MRGWTDGCRTGVAVGRLTTRRRADHVSAGVATARHETLAVEEPLEIRVGGAALTVTMRTPGHDVELTQGFLFSEGIVAGREDIATARYCGGTGEDGTNTYNLLTVTLAPGVPTPAPARSFVANSSCGVCGKSSLDAVQTQSRYVPGDDAVTVSAAALTALPDRLRAAQTAFAATGGLHAAALFDFTADPAGSLLVVREDIGRHNAVDKVIGWAVERGRIPLTGTVLLVSGRVSFELAQKAAMAGVPVLAAVSAPSSLAVDLADRFGLTLVAFLRGDSMNVYTRPDRVIA